MRYYLTERCKSLTFKAILLTGRLWLESLDTKKALLRFLEAQTQQLRSRHALSSSPATILQQNFFGLWDISSIVF